MPAAACHGCKPAELRQFLALNAVLRPKTGGLSPNLAVCWRAQRMEGKTLSSTDTVENNPQPDEAQAVARRPRSHPITITKVMITKVTTTSMARF
jgi:hypothetical protein